MTRDYLYDILQSLNCPILSPYGYQTTDIKLFPQVFQWLQLQTEKLRGLKVPVDDTAKGVLGAQMRVQDSVSKVILNTTTSTRYAENAGIACLEAAIPTTPQICSSPVGLDRLHPAMW